MRFRISVASCVFGSFLALASSAASADGQLFRIDSRPGVQTPVFWEEQAGATATVLLFPGGGGGFGKVENGKPTGGNFLVRSVPHFLAQGFNVAIFGRPSDSEDLDYADRISTNHMTDIRAAVEFVKARSRLPLWLVGTSRGTVSVTAATIQLQEPAIAGLVLTSSVVNYKKPGAIPKQDLAAIRVPVLVLHHAEDTCQHCRPVEVPAILRGLKNAPVKKQLIVSGGANPSGDPCGAQHWHGFIGMEKEAVGMIGEWIRQPMP